MASAVVILAYVAVLTVILRPPRGLGFQGDDAPWWKNVRFWAAVVIVLQIAVYARWG